MTVRVALSPFTPEHGRVLVTRCLDFYSVRPVDEDGWRRTEWPFCSLRATENFALSLSLQPVADGIPAAFAFAAGHALRDAPPDGNWIPDGVVAATHFDEESRSALLGTYVTPSERGQGIQRFAKEALFEKLRGFIRTYYLLIHAENAPSLRAAEKLAMTREICASGLPPRLRSEFGNHSVNTRVFRIDLR